MDTSGEEFCAPDAKILVVDDNEINLKVFLGLLKNRGMQIDTATSGRKCLEMMQKKAYHIIFMDHQMPEMDGCEAARQIRQLPRRDAASVPILALTGNSSSEDVEAAMQAGMNDYMVKPVKMKLLAKVMSEYIHV